MNAYLLKAIALTFVIALTSACTTTEKYVSTQDQLQQQLNTLATLQRKITTANTEDERNNLLMEQQRAIQQSINTLEQIQQSKRDANIECIEREKSVPLGDETCHEVESLDDTRITMMVALMQQLLLRTQGH
ncbi:hypothetical protein [Alteromonas macleodii]|uniref:Lipoprotein n=1 Tax=Alteromonas macleodii TaxID=28108 RepID=A0AB36FR29_ALTMA|nr:hypothetical protein [Alteromonas macleodii]OES24447.1 putative lipoprotein [Alteromonas macleodii]OES25504.1 putative lipoprotein [Alteromonas macleodii]OES25807.1 putative lipoprotein [Alteromonas macleodii]OES38674.1 putative lipoprotein [Alteromonas macleodii]